MYIKRGLLFLFAKLALVILSLEAKHDCHTEQGQCDKLAVNIKHKVNAWMWMR